MKNKKERNSPPTRVEDSSNQDNPDRVLGATSGSALYPDPALRLKLADDIEAAERALEGISDEEITSSNKTPEVYAALEKAHGFMKNVCQQLDKKVDEIAAAEGFETTADFEAVYGR